MIYNLASETESQRFMDMVAKAKEERRTVELTYKNPNRSLASNRYLHLLLGAFACEFGLTLEEVKLDYFKKKVNPDIFIREHRNKRGDTVRYVRSSADLDTAEMATAIDRFRNWSAMEAGLYLPSPEEREYLNYINNEMERHAAFI